MRICFIKSFFPYVLLKRDLGSNLKGRARLFLVELNKSKTEQDFSLIHEEQHVLHWYMTAIPLIILISILTIYEILPITIAYIAILISIFIYNISCKMFDSIRLIAEIDCFRAENHHSNVDRSKELAKILSNSYGFDIYVQEAERRIRKGTRHAKKV